MEALFVKQALVPQLEALRDVLKGLKEGKMGESMKRWLGGLGVAFVVGTLTACMDALNAGTFDKRSLGIALAAGVSSIITLLKQSPIPPKE